MDTNRLSAPVPALELSPEAAQLLSAANDMFFKHGISGSTIEMIAHAADICPKLAAEIYPTMADVLRALVERDYRDMTELYANMIDATGRPDLRLTCLIRETIIRSAKSYLCQIIYSAGRVENHADRAFFFEHVPVQLADFRKHNTAIICRIIAQGQLDGTFAQFDPAQGAFLLRGLLHSALFYKLEAQLNDQEIEEHADLIIKLFFRGILR